MVLELTTFGQPPKNYSRMALTEQVLDTLEKTVQAQDQTKYIAFCSRDFRLLRVWNLIKWCGPPEEVSVSYLRIG
ncbi:hypothetical protein BJX66DRAFT_345734 [Aspergillus keveii]|uniref:Uncharacterized protein n=1 Tax=Aspergillus keveii TaxID=714993 RepID=A0ABR4FH42_9EURO